MKIFGPKKKEKLVKQLKPNYLSELSQKFKNMID